jgi:4'-phosphopantetheinyl transferase
MSVRTPNTAVKVYYTDLSPLTDPSYLDRCFAILDDQEKQRFELLALENNQKEFLVGHALVRWTLSCLTHVPPQDWHYQQGEQGKPEIHAPADYKALKFNLSHTDGMVVCAINWNNRIGIDVENEISRTGKTAGLAQKFFTQDEVTRLNALPLSARRHRFFQLWTLKESFIKALGAGMSIPLNQFSFHWDERGLIQARFDSALDEELSQWEFHQWQLTDHHIMAVSFECPGAEEKKIQLQAVTPLESAAI